jgi:Domain of unknown function (DUF397)
MDLTGAIWRKASRSGNAGNCVEVAGNLPGVVAVRDSKDPDAQALLLAPPRWREFTAAARAGHFDPAT